MESKKPQPVLTPESPYRSRRPPEAVRRSADPAVGIAVVLLGCLLTFYLVGLLLIPLGAWLWRRALPA